MDYDGLMFKYDKNRFPDIELTDDEINNQLHQNEKIDPVTRKSWMMRR